MTVTALLDACVLVPQATTDLLLRLAERKLYRPLWSDGVLEEVNRAVRRVRPGLAVQRIERRLTAMDTGFPDARVEGWEQHFEQAIELPDPGDRHVVAAALHGKADLIVTSNLRDFPAERLAAVRLRAVHQDDFLLDLWSRRPDVVSEVLVAICAESLRPPLAMADLLDQLVRAHVPRFAEVVRHALS